MELYLKVSELSKEFNDKFRYDLSDEVKRDMIRKYHKDIEELKKQHSND